MTTPSAISISRPPNSFFVTTGTFESRRNILFRRPHPLSLPITTQAGETCHRNKLFRRLHPSSLTTTATTPVPYTVRSNLRPCDWSNALPQHLLALNELSGVRVILSVSTLEVRTGGWFVDVRTEELTNSSFARNSRGSVKCHTAAIRCLYDEHPPPC